MLSIKEIDSVPKYFGFYRERKRHAVLEAAVSGDESGGVDEWRNILQDYRPCLKKGVIIPCPIRDSSSPIPTLRDICCAAEFCEADIVDR